MKIKTSKRKVKTGNPELQKMFNQMLGAQDADPSIIESKYEEMYEHMRIIIKVWENFKNSAHFSYLINEFPSAMDEIATFIKLSKSEVLACKLIPSNKKQSTKLIDNSKQSILTELLETGSSYDSAELNKAYRGLKKSTFHIHLMKTFNLFKLTLNNEKERSNSPVSNLDLRDHLSDSFIINADGGSLKLLSFTKWDFKVLAVSSYYETFKKYMLLLLHLTYVTIDKIYKLTISPDIDIDSFSEMMVKSITDLRKNPELRDCADAFMKLESSLDLLKGNFHDYYKGFMQTGNATIILESFIKDIITNSGKNVKLSKQFLKINNFVKKRMKTPANKKNPQLSSLLSMIDQNINKLSDLEEKNK